MSVTPREAATLVLLRDRNGAAEGPEVLMVQRHGRDVFAASAFVFPGGVLEAADCRPEAAGAPEQAGTEPALERLQEVESAAHALGFYVAAIRETFEEVGVLLATDATGQTWRPEPGQGEALLAARSAVGAGELDFLDWLRGEGLRPAVEGLVYFGHWITPVGRPKRFDTRFFAARWPGGQAIAPDLREIVAYRWITPAEALAAQSAGEMRMVGATVRNLEMLAKFGDAAEALTALSERDVQAVRPKLAPGPDGTPRPVYPWDPEYDSL